MPVFGFDPHEVEQKLKNEIPEPEKIFLDVTMLQTKDGQILPLSFIFEDKEYSVGKILEIQKGHSLKVFSPGLRYLCQKGKRKYHLHYDGERWYIERKKVS